MSEAASNTVRELPYVMAINEGIREVLREQKNAFIAGEDIVESDVGLYDRIIRANVKAGGHEVIKELDILPHYTHHRMYYTTLDNTLPIGTEVVGATSGVKARVMEHDTENKFFVLYSGALKWDSNHNGEDFTTEAIKNLALSTNN